MRANKKAANLIAARLNFKLITVGSMEWLLGCSAARLLGCSAARLESDDSRPRGFQYLEDFALSASLKKELLLSKPQTSEQVNLTDVAF
ncbi:MAG: hypothetical protein IPN69_02440 [Acidobacteria bacterium]|nr:hypothetical protein [Acidobacteriota bacterium]